MDGCEILHQLIGGLFPLKGFNRPFGGAGFLPPTVARNFTILQRVQKLHEFASILKRKLRGELVVSEVMGVHPVMIHFRLGFPIINHAFEGTRIYGNPKI